MRIQRTTKTVHEESWLVQVAGRLVVRSLGTALKVSMIQGYRRPLIMWLLVVVSM